MRNSKTYELVLTGLFTAIIIVMALTPLGYIPLVVINATTIHIPVILGAIFLGPKKGGFLGGVFGITSLLKSTLAPSSLSAFVFSPVIAVSTLAPVGAGATILIVLKSLFIPLVPRILIGVVPYYVYNGIKKLVSSEKKTSAVVVATVVGLFLGFGVYAFINKISPDFNTVAKAVIAVVVAAAAIIFFLVVMKGNDAKSLGFITAGICGSLTNTLLVMGSIFLFYKEPYSEAVGVAADALLAMIGGIISFNGVVEAIVAAIIVYLVGIVLDKIKPAGQTA